MKSQPIKSSADYQKALERLEVIFDAKPGTAEGSELENLAAMILNYENNIDPSL